MRTTMAGIMSAFLMLATPPSVQATSLQIAPVLLEIPATGAASKLILKNTGSEQVKAQIRVFKWIQKNGKDELVPTRDVVASPPLAKVSANGTNTVRIVRISKTPPKGEEAYRLIVDQLPDKSKDTGFGVKLQMRYSIPVFFGANTGVVPRLAWTVKNNGSNLVVKNNSKRHARISELKIQSSKGTDIAIKNGLVGYVLSNSTASFDLKLARKAKTNSRVLITANERSGKINLKSRVQ